MSPTQPKPPVKDEANGSDGAIQTVDTSPINVDISWLGQQNTIQYYFCKTVRSLKIRLSDKLM
jgi:hypothetical protein